MENILTGPVITGSFEKRAPGVCIWTCVLFCVALGYVYVVLQSWKNLSVVVTFVNL